MALSRKEKENVVTKEGLAKRWGIGLDTTYRTLKTMTLQGIRSFIHPVKRRFPTSWPHLVFPTMQLHVYANMLFAKIKSIHQNTCAQLYTDGKGYTLFYPL
jgi:hypothetical protein